MSKTVAIRCVINKPEHEDTLYGTGQWMPGQVRQVDAEVASWLLFHPDVYEDARPEKLRKKEPIAPQKKPQSYKKDQFENQPSPANLLAMDKGALAQYALREFSHRINTEEKTDQQVRGEVRDLIRTRA
jgi:hypothetical protein